MTRIFISSTFRDMDDERDVLREVAAELDAEAFHVGESVSMCDLRWGVDTLGLEGEAMMSKVVNACLDEIDRCRPYMIVLLGERYGASLDRCLVARVLRGRGRLPVEADLSATALEIEYGALSSPGGLDRILFYFREESPDMPEKYRDEHGNASKLAALKQRIVAAGGRVRRYRLEWNSEGGVVGGLKEFREQACRDLRKLLRSGWREWDKKPLHVREERIHRGFAERAGACFDGRKELFAQCWAGLQGGMPVFCVQGRPGTGKTTLLSRLALEWGRHGGEALPIFCGLTAGSNNAQDVVRAIVRHCAPGGREPHGMEDTPGNWAALLEKALERRGKKSPPLAVFVDGVDQLSDNPGRDHLLFVPPKLPAGVRMVLSGLDTFKFPGWMPVVRVKNLPKEETARLLDAISRAQGGELDRTVRKAILAKPASGNPLYLRLLRYRLELMGREDYEASVPGMEGISLRQREIVEGAGKSLESLCTDIFGVVERMIRGGWVRTAVSCLAASRRGLREADLAAVLGVRGHVLDSLEFARFRTFLHPFFQEREDGRIDFAHPGFRRGLCRARGEMARQRRALLRWFGESKKNTPVQDEETVHACQALDDGKALVRRLPCFSGEELAWTACAKVFYDGLCADGGAFARRVAAGIGTPGEWMDVCDFLNFHVAVRLDGLPEHRRALCCVMERLIRKGRRFARASKSAGTGLVRQLGVLERQTGRLFEENGTREDLSRALKHFREARRWFEMSSSGGGEAVVRENAERDLVAVWLDTGHIEERLAEGRRAGKALDAYREAWRHAQRLARQFGEDASAGERFRVLYDLGDWHWQAKRKDDFKRARRYLLRAVAVFKEAAGRGVVCAPEQDLSKCHARLSQWYFAQETPGALRLAVKEGECALVTARKLLRTDRTSETFRACLVSTLDLANACLAKGDGSSLVRAADLCAEAARLGVVWTKQEKSVDARQFLAQAYGTWANALLKQDERGNHAVAQRLYEKSAVILRRLLDEGADGDVRADLSSTLFFMGRALKQAGGRRNQEKARELLATALELDKSLCKIRRTWRRNDNLTATRRLLDALSKTLDGQ